MQQFFKKYMKKFQALTAVCCLELPFFARGKECAVLACQIPENMLIYIKKQITFEKEKIL